MTPLHLAATSGKLEIARLLLDNGADKEARNVLSMTPLHFAAMCGKIDVAKLLLKCRADTETVNGVRFPFLE